MLQVFHLNVAKVYLNVPYDAMTIHVYFKCFTFFQSYVASVSTREHMLQRPRSLGGTAACRSCLLLLLGHRHGSPCERLRLKDISAMHMHRLVRRARSCPLPPYYTGATGAMREQGAASEHLLQLDIVGC
jgi:hypothetical protein